MSKQLLKLPRVDKEGSVFIDIDQISALKQEINANGVVYTNVFINSKEHSFSVKLSLSDLVDGLKKAGVDIVEVN